jgi:hypothetical protein
MSVQGAEIGRQFIGGDPSHYEWRVRYVPSGGGQAFLMVSSQDADCPEMAMAIATQQLFHSDSKSGRD